MDKLSLGKKILIGAAIWLVIMLVLLLIRWLQLQKQAENQRLAQQLAAQTLNYEQSASVLLQETLELENFSKVLVLPQVDTNFRLD